MIIIHIAYYLLLFCFGFAIMSIELLSSRILAPFFGGSIYIWGSIISTFMVSMSIGYVIGSIISIRIQKILPLLILLILASVWIFLIPLIYNPMGEIISNIINDIRLGSFVMMNVIFTIPIIIMTMVSPYIIELLNSKQKRFRTSSGLILFVSTLGAFFGTITTAFYLIALFPVSQIIIVIGVVCFSLSILILFLKIDYHHELNS